VEKKVGKGPAYDYADGGRLRPFSGTHPEAMASRVEGQNWRFEYDPSLVKIPLKDRLLDGVEDLTGVRIGEYKNYELL
jgi:hypothetical protein